MALCATHLLPTIRADERVAHAIEAELEDESFDVDGTVGGTAAAGHTDEGSKLQCLFDCKG
jgi:hypothetical protein